MARTHLSTPPDFMQLKLGEYSEPIEIESSDQNRLATLSLVSQATGMLDIFSRALDPAIYDHAEFVDAVKRLILDNRRARVRVLVQDVPTLVARGHGLLELAQRLTSAMQIRVPAREHQNFNAALLVVDCKGAIHRLHADRFEGTLTFNDRAYASDLTREFDSMWEIAKPDPNLRRLHV